MLTLDPIPGIYNSYVANGLPHTGEALRNVVRIHHDYDHTLYRGIHLARQSRFRIRRVFDNGSAQA